MTTSLSWRVLIFVVLGGCAGRSLDVNDPSEEVQRCAGVDGPMQWPSATEFVARLRAIARGEIAGSLEAHVDRDFAERLPSGEPLASLFTEPPGDCTLAFAEDPGYGAIAIPPPMVDDSEEDVARTRAIIDVLAAAIEVTTMCAASSPEDEPRPLYTIAVLRDDDGAFRALAWRDFRAESVP
jgi:hypothetical protein